MDDFTLPNAPRLSVIVAVVTDTAQKLDTSHLVACLQALRQQVDPPSIEILVPYPASMKAIEPLHSAFPEVTFLPLTDLKFYTASSSTSAGGREHHNELRARGLAAARGEIVAFVEDYGVPALDWCRKISAAYPGAYTGLGGAIENAVDRPLNWAVYFSDFASYQNPLPAGPTHSATDANVSYLRQALEAIRPVWQTVFEEPKVNQALIDRGFSLGLSPELVVYHHRRNLSLGTAVAERFIWGRSYAAYRARWMSLPKRIMAAAITPLLPLLLTLRTSQTVTKKGRSQAALVKSLPALLLLAAAWSLGELVGLLTGKASGAQPISTAPHLAANAD